MSQYIISYDLHNVRHYQPVWSALEAWGAVRILESVWLLTINAAAVQIRDTLKQIIDTDDSVAVIQLQPGSSWATERAKDAGIAWLRQNIAS